MTEALQAPAAVLLGAAGALRPTPQLSLSEWADEHFYLSVESAADPGPWRSLPYQRAWMDAVTDPRIAQISVMKSARVGATKVLNAAVGYHVEHKPCALYVIQPSEDDAKGYSKEEIEPMLRDCPAVGQKFEAYARKNSMLHKRFTGGLLQIVGARSPGNFRRVSRGVIFGDEVDGYPASAGNEGDPVALATKRADYFGKRKRKLMWVSTPTIAGFSRIEQLFLAGDQRRFYVPCPHCGHMQVLQFPNLRWDGDPAGAYFRCIACEQHIEHAAKRAIVTAGDWRPGPHSQFPQDPPPASFHGHASFHIWAAYSFSPNATWGQLAAEFLAAKRAGTEQLKTYVNTVLGETWKERGEAPEWRRLYDRRELYVIGACPEGVLFLTAGVDVQHDRIVWEIVGWGRDKESWSIDSGVIPGDTSNLTPKGPWRQLEALLDRDYPTDGGPALRIRLMAVDSGDQTQTVYNWVRTKDPGRVIAVKGVDSADVLINSGSKVDVSMRGKRVGWVRLYLVGKEAALTELYGWLKLDLPTEEERAEGATVPPGYCHFPQYGEQFFKELTAVQLVTRKNPRGFPIRSWELIPGRTDDFLAARRYARAAACLAGLDRMRESDWATLEQRLGIERPTPKPDAPAETPPPPKAPKREPWIQRRRPGGWLKGDR